MVEWDPLMILSCPSCQARYLVNPVQLGDVGRRVKCARCHHVWYESRPPDPPPPPQPPLSATSPSPAADGPRPVVRPGATADVKAGGSSDGFASETPVSGQLPSTVVRRPSRVPAAFWTLLVLLVGAVAVVGAVAGGDVVRFYPPTIAIYDAVGLPVDRSVLADHSDLQPALDFVDLDSRVGEDGTLILAGAVINSAADQRRVLPLIVTLRDAEGAELTSQEIDLGQTTLDGGESVAFESVIDPWPDDAVDADLSFAR